MIRNWKNAQFGSVRGFLARQLLRINQLYWGKVERVSVQEIRERNEKLTSKVSQPPENIEIRHIDVDGLHVQSLKIGNTTPGKALLYFHGGGFIGGSPDTSHADFIWRIAEGASCAVFAPFYRKAPEFPYPAALDDALKAYEYLLERYKPEQITLGGDSSGGGLSLSLMLKLKDLGKPLPAALVLLSPWIDLKATGKSLITNIATDSIVPGHLVKQIGALYLSGEDPENPYASPFYGEFDAFPPTLIQVSDTEVLLDDSLRLAEKMESAGVNVRLDVWRNQPHVWQVFARWVPESRAALEDISEFLKRF